MDAIRLRPIATRIFSTTAGKMLGTQYIQSTGNVFVRTEDFIKQLKRNEESSSTVEANRLSFTPQKTVAQDVGAGCGYSLQDRGYTEVGTERARQGLCAIMWGAVCQNPHLEPRSLERYASLKQEAPGDLDGPIENWNL